jgi:SAM-dependent methyltransferase
MRLPLGKFLRSWRSHGLGPTLRIAFSRLAEELQERRLGISTSQTVELPDLGVNNPSYHRYSATTYGTFRNIMRHVDIRANEDVFVDFGAGKGRAVVLAAQYPFRKVIGVELCEPLAEVARRNVAAASRHLKCGNVEIVQADATQWPLPDDATVLFFFNPFHGEFLDGVFAGVRESLARSPRRLTVIFVRSSHFEEEVRWKDWLDRKIVITCREQTSAVYVNKPTGPAGS